MGVLVEQPTVAVWCNEWLGQSETFIRNLMAGLDRYRPIGLGLRSNDDPLVRPVYAPYGTDLRAGLEQRRFGAGLVPTGYRAAMRADDVALIHSHYAPDSYFAARLAVRARVPLVSMFHGYDVTQLPPVSTLTGRTYRSRLRYVFAHAAILLAVSDFIAEQLIALGAPAAKIRTHYIGIPVDRAPATVADRDGIVFTGRFVEKKGITDLLAAVALLPEPLRSVRVRLIGYGPLEDEIRSLVQAEQLNVEFAGRLSSDAVGDTLAAARIFCAPSKTSRTGDAEGFGMVFLEGALAGLPVVSYRHGGIPEAVADGVTGLLAPEGDVGALSQALARLLTDPELAARLGAAGRARVLAAFDLRARTVLLERAYDDAIASGPA